MINQEIAKEETTNLVVSSLCKAINYYCLLEIMGIKFSKHHLVFLCWLLAWF